MEVDKMFGKFDKEIRKILPDGTIVYSPLCINCENHPCTCLNHAEDLAVAHWEWVETLLRKIYIDAFKHGYKHGKEENV